MGTWGPGLYQNDVSDDIKLGFIDKCKRGHTIEEATEIFIKEYAEELEDEEDAPNFWFALADIQWKYGKLLPKVKENALFHIENELKNETYNEFDKSDARKRKKVLEDLREKLNSPMPPEKKISQYRLYQCEWKVGDIYAYPLDAEVWKDNAYYGEYLIMQKIGERDWWPGHIIPVVVVKITENKHLPSSADEMEKLKYIILEERSPEKRYTLGLGNTSKRIIPKKLIYMGNYDLFPTPDDAEHIDLEDMYTYSEWKFFDECIGLSLKVFGCISANECKN